MTFNLPIKDVREPCILKRKETRDILSEKQGVKNRLQYKTGFKILCTRRSIKNLKGPHSIGGSYLLFVYLTFYNEYVLLSQQRGK